MPEYPARGRRRPPTHPGELLREDILPAMGIAVSEFARRIGLPCASVPKLTSSFRFVESSR